MQHLFRLSQKLKPETSVSHYDPVLRAALDGYLDRPRVPSLSSFSEPVEQRMAAGTLSDSSASFQLFIVDLLTPLSRAWEELNARRLELESLRPDRRLSTVHEEAVKLLRGGLKLWNLQAEVLHKAVEGDWPLSAQKEKDAELWSGIVARVEDKPTEALRAVRRDHQALFLLLELSPQIVEWAGLPRPGAASASSHSAALRQNENRADREQPASQGGDDNSVSPEQLAAYMKALFFGGSAQELSHHPHARVLYDELELLAQRPADWWSLSEKQLQWIAFEQILHVTFDDASGMGSLPALYQFAVVPRLDSNARRSLEESVATVLDSDDRQIKALTFFMAMDPDPGIVTTASLDYATLIPLKDSDPLTGPKACVQFAQKTVETSEAQAASILAGVLLLGDRRVLPLLDGCWTAFGATGQGQLCEARSGIIFASMAEFYLRWLEAVGEDDFGFPAGALGRLAEGATRHANVRDVERRFPAPFNLTPEDYESNPAINELQQWTIPEFARIIEPRLRQLYLRETYDKVMPRVLEAWGLEVGMDSEEDQHRHIFAKFEKDVAQLRRLADSVAHKEQGATADERARKFIAGVFTDFSPPEALAMAKSVVQAFPQFADNARSEAERQQDPQQQTQLLAKARSRVDEAATITSHLRRQFGPDLDVVFRDLTRVWLKVRPDALPSITLAEAPVFESQQEERLVGDWNLIAPMRGLDQRTYVVSSAADGDFKDLADAVAHAEPGSRLVVSPGVYEGSIELARPLEIVGHGPIDEIVISATDASTIAILVPGVLIRGLTISRNGGSERDSALRLYRGDTLIEGCTLTSTGSDVVQIMSAMANPTLRGCTIRDCPGVGVRVQLGAKGHIEDCDIERNGSAGVAIVAEADPVLLNNRIRDGFGIGVVIARASRGTLDNNEITDNSGAGIDIVMGSAPIIRNCRISANGDVAVRVDESCAGSIENCDLTDNAGGPWDIASGSRFQRQDNREGHIA